MVTPRNSSCQDWHNHHQNGCLFLPWPSPFLAVASRQPGFSQKFSQKSGVEIPKNQKKKTPGGMINILLFPLERNYFVVLNQKQTSLPSQCSIFSNPSHPSQSQHHQIGIDSKLCPGPPAVPPGFAYGSQPALRAPPLVAPRVPQPLPRQRPVGSLDRWIVRGKKKQGNQSATCQKYGDFLGFSGIWPKYGSVSKPCTPVVHIKIAGIYGCSSP